jgi:hypothetical protein
MVLSDLGGEPLKRLRPELKNIFPGGVMLYGWRDATYEYAFKAINTVKRLDNRSLFVDGERLVQRHDLNDAMEDVITLLLHGAAAFAEDVPEVVREKCVVGALIGQKVELERYVKQRYIWVSRITRGATANALGQLAQGYVKELLDAALPSWAFTMSGTIPGVSQNDGRTETSFDIVAKSPKAKYVAIEVAFQFTTNSVIERKQGQAPERHRALRRAGHHIAYVIDGAGNFERRAALATICKYSDCTVALTPEEISVLASFLSRVG